jgi:ABC-type Fe3+/spermidine/putrescine transport system ATPase subunit
MIALQSVTKTFGTVTALDDLTFEIPAGQTMVIQGPSGSGKTTLLRLIAGLDLPTHGEIHIDGELSSTQTYATPPYTRGIGMVFQRSALWPHMTVAQNIRFAARTETAPEADAIVTELLEETELVELQGRYPSQLSGGEARRVALARAVAARPKRLLLDEPLTSLDPDLKLRVLAVIKDYATDSAATLIYVTHILDEAQQVGGRFMRLDRGRLVV